MEPYISVRIIFDSSEAATEALIAVLEDARETDKDYSFGSLSVSQIMASGLLLIGDASHLSDKLKQITGATVLPE